MHLRPQPTALVTLGLSITLVLGSTAASAGEGPPFDATQARTAIDAHPLFPVAPLGAAAQVSTATTSTVFDHQFGVGVYLGGESHGIGGGVRYFFYAGPLGVQAEVWHLGFDLGSFDSDGVQFAPSAIYRFREFPFEAPASLVPYAGLGLSFVHADIGGNNFPDESDTSVGIMLYGGVELFFERIPNLGVGGELRFTSNDDDFAGFDTDLGGASFVAQGHWYFW